MTKYDFVCQFVMDYINGMNYDISRDQSENFRVCRSAAERAAQAALVIYDEINTVLGNNRNKFMKHKEVCDVRSRE